MSVRPSLRTEHCVSQWRGFHETWYKTIFRQSVKKIQLSDKNNESFKWRPMYIYDHLSPISSQNEKYFKQKMQRKSNHAFYARSRFTKNRAVDEITWHNYGTARQATDDSIVRRRKDEICMPDN